jgi:uncharacterized protein involved in outer membrane biogenesis
VNSSIVRRGLIGAAAILAALVVMAAGLAGALDAGYFREPLIRLLAARAGRQIQVGGALDAHFFSLHPRLVAARVTIFNPPWMPSGVTAEIGRMSLVFRIPPISHAFGIVRLDMEAATFHLVRDSTGRANWQMTAPDKNDSGDLPILRVLSIPNAHVVLDDALRNLQFDGTVSAQDESGMGGLQSLRLAGRGQLNGRAASFEIIGDPLATASHKRPYHFAFDERSSGSRLTGQGYLPRPFDFDLLDTSFDAAGADLKDLHFLTGVALVNTGIYRLSGKLARRGTNSKFSDLVLTSGQSDVQGTVSVESSSGRPKLDIDLNSKNLRMSDLGERAAGLISKPETGAPLLLSEAMLDPGMMRRGDAVVTFRAHRVDLGRVSLQEVSAKATIDHGILAVAPLLADVLGGKLIAHVRLDARPEVPAADVNLKISDLQLGQIDRKDSVQPPVEGLLQAQVMITGRGRSIHQVAASANGTVTAALPHGAIRAALAELTGVDLRGLGLLVSKSTQETPVRCGVARFEAREGTLTAQTLVVDTDPVLITGEGVIHLDSEALDLALRGHPKSVRLFRLRSTVSVRGTLAHPSANILEGKSVLVLIDPGRAKDADCTALLAAANLRDPRTR